MKILEVVHRFPPAIGGSEKVVYELSREFVAQGHDVTVVTSSSLDNNDTRGFSTGRSFSLKSKTYEKHKEMMDGIKVIRFEPSFQFWTFAINPKMKQFLESNIENFDIIHVHGYQAYEAYIVSKMCKKKKKAFVLTAHDIISHYPGFFKLIKKLYDLVIGKRILNNSSGLIALTQENVDQYNEILECSNKISIIPNGINSYAKKQKDKSILNQIGNPDKIILFVGRIVKYKGCQEIIHALPTILKKYPKTMVLFVGKDGGYTPTLSKLSEQLSVNRNCIFTGPVDDIEKYLNLADVFVFPSRGEGFGLSPVEAMSVGVPGILANMGGLKYVLKDIGGIPINMDEDVPSQISKNVVDIFDGKLTSKDLSKFEKNAKNYRWDKISKQTLKFLILSSDRMKSKEI